MSHYEQLHLSRGDMKLLVTVNHYENKDATPQLTLSLMGLEEQSITFGKEESAIVSAFISDAMTRKATP